MARGKSVKVDYKGIKASYIDGELKGTLEVVDEETGEVSTSDINLTVETKDVLASLQEDEKITITVKKFKAMSAKDKPQIFKYTCGCGKEIKSKIEGLDITCNECEETFCMEIGDK
jgi:hypothetical protein